MHKHRRKQQGKFGHWPNANSKIPDACSDLIRSLGSRLIGDGPDFDYLRDQYLSKYCDESLVPAVARRQKAIARWYAQEIINGSTNEMLASLDDSFNILPRVTLRRFLSVCRTIIARVFGPLPDFCPDGSFSGGASTSRRRTESLPALKFTGRADVTSDAAKFVSLVREANPLLREYRIFEDLRIQDYSVLFTVPKKTDIDRCACKEPDINMFLQKGVGKLLRNRLRREGINLRDQKRNRDLARLGSLDGSLATLDLSSASDSITVECVRMLLPQDWFEYLNDIRSHYCAVEGEITKLQMFSSMGNGFTFELESLIFYALMRTTAYFEGIRGIISIYGDDIIIPSGMYDLASFVLTKFGFVLNKEKSFSAGPFRESCGGHFHNGLDITPFYLKQRPTRLTDVIRVANQLRRWASAGTVWSRDIGSNSYQLWQELAAYVPRDLWGGYDLELDTQLVSPTLPNKALVRQTVKREVPDKGSYVHWHNTNWNRTALDDSKSEPLSTNQICRKRRAPPGDNRHRSPFFEEEGILQSGSQP